MKAIQYLLIAVIIVAGIAGAICALEYLPLGGSILPAWATAWLPPLGGAAAGWLIFGIIAAIVVCALLVAAVSRSIDRRSISA